LLLDYPWPGNVRELFNAIERAAVLASHKQLAAEDLPEDVRRPLSAAVGAGAGTLADIERQAILAALNTERGNRAKTAARLGIGQATLFRKLKQYQAEGHSVAPAA
jgi:transcriptional regulator of acetoin/glycerol metabolism